MVGKKRHYLNLNKFRNNHFQLNNKMKIMYRDIVISKLLQHKNKQYKKIALEFTYYKPTKAKRDRANILCIIEKYFWLQYCLLVHNFKFIRTIFEGDEMGTVEEGKEIIIRVASGTETIEEYI